MGNREYILANIAAVQAEIDTLNAKKDSYIQLRDGITGSVLPQLSDCQGKISSASSSLSNHLKGGSVGAVNANLLSNGDTISSVLAGFSGTILSEVNQQISKITVKIAGKRTVIASLRMQLAFLKD